MSKPVILVTGATGAQGGSVVKYLLADGSFSIRALTRNPESVKAKELVAKGVEVVKGDLDDPKSVHDALKGVHGVFLVTDFWGNLGKVMQAPPQDKLPTHVAAENEIAQGKLVVDAAKAAGVKHFVFSAVERTTIGAVHCDSKDTIAKYLRASGVPNSSVYTAMFFQNFLGPFALKKTESGEVVADWPMIWTDGKIPAFDIESLGAYVLEALKNPEKWIGKDLSVKWEIITPRKVVETLREVSGSPITLKEYNAEDFERAKDIPGLLEIYLNMKWFYIRDSQGGLNNQLETPEIGAEYKSFETWAREYVSALVQN